jgi:hypothetical protein
MHKTTTAQQHKTLCGRNFGPATASTRLDFPLLLCVGKPLE